MSDDMIRSLNAEIARLNDQLSDARSEAAKYRKAKQVALRDKEAALAETTNHAKEKEAFKALRKEYDALRSTKDPEELQKKLADLEVQVKSRAFKDVYEKVARDKNIRPEAMDKVLKLLDVDPTSDPDPDALGGSLDSFLHENPYFVGEHQEVEEKPLTPGPGLGRGSGSFADDLFTVRESDLQNLTWMSRNQKKYAKAQRDGTLNFVADVIGGASM